jgi:putative transposase
MAHTFTTSYYHCVFSTKERRAFISEDIQARIWSYMGGIAKQNGFKAISIGGIEDHLHILLSLPATMPVSKAVQLIKGGSSKWIHDNFSHLQLFSWQQGYAAFSIGVSDIQRTVRYIENQRAHHTRVDFRGEILQFLKKHNIDYDEKDVLG